jgi:hypothetical protein
MRHVRTRRGEKISKSKMKIATIEKRMPFEIALSCAFQSGLDPSLELVMQRELESLVVESAKKFTGYKNQESIRKALDLTLGILSLAVVHSTKGKVDSKAWAKYLIERGMKDLAREAVEMIKPLAESSSMSSFNTFLPGSEGSVRDILIHYATKFDQTSGVWRGYREYTTSVSAHLEARRMENLANYLIEKFTRKTSGGWLRHMEDITNSSWENSIVDEILNTFIFRYSVGLPTLGDITLKLRQFVQLRDIYEKDKQTWKGNTKRKYQKLVEETPPELRVGYLNRGDWFNNHLAKGPPKIPKRIKDKYFVEGVSAVYLFNPFE